MKIRAVVHDAEEGGFWAEVPALPGCLTQGDSLSEIESNLHDAVAGWIAAGETAIDLDSSRIIEVSV